MADTTIMRRNNLQLVLDAVSENGEITASELVKITGLSVATISRVISQLRAKKLVLQDRKADSELGRKPETCRVNGGYGCSLYINLKCGGLQCYLLDFSGTVIGQTETPVDPELTVEDFLNLTKEQITKLYNSEFGDILAVCLSVPGQLDRTSGTVRRIPNFPNFEYVPLAERVEKCIGVPCMIWNTARLTAWGCCQVHRVPEDNLIYIDITADGGIGAGLVIDGRLYEDRAGHVGEMGDMIVNIRPYDRAQMLSRGALEQESGLNTVLRRCAALLEQGKAPTLAGMLESAELPTLSQLEEASRKDPEVAAVLEEATRSWAAAIVNLVAVLSPDEVVLGGDLSEKNWRIASMIRRHLSDLYYRAVRLRLAEADVLYHVKGAAAMLCRMLFDDALDHIAE